MKKIRVASVQIEHADGKKAANLAKIRHFVEKAAAHDVRLITFPECCITGYWFLRNLSREETTALAEPIPNGPSSQALMELAREFNMSIGAGLVEIADDGTMYNTYVVALSTGEFHCHRKLHCFVSEHLESGDAFTVFDTPEGWRVGVLICYDNNLVENVRVTALMGADIVMMPHQTGGVNSSDPHTMGLVDIALWKNREDDPQAIEAELKGPKGRGWLMRWLPTRAYDNGVFAIFSNGIGFDDDEIRTGNAMVIDPNARILSETWRAGDDMVIADLDPSLFELNLGRRFISVRRPELYSPLLRKTGKEIDTRSVRMDGKGA